MEQQCKVSSRGVKCLRAAVRDGLCLMHAGRPQGWLQAAASQLDPCPALVCTCGRAPFTPQTAAGRSPQTLFLLAESNTRSLLDQIEEALDECPELELAPPKGRKARRWWSAGYRVGHWLALQKIRREARP